MNTKVHRLKFALFNLFTALIVSACGGGGGGGVSGEGSALEDYSDPSRSVGDSRAASVSGVAVKGVLSTADVRAYAVENNQRGDLLGEGQTDSSGRYSIVLSRAMDNIVVVLSSNRDTLSVCDAADGCGAHSSSANDTNGDGVVNWGERYFPGFDLALEALYDGDDSTDITVLSHLATRLAFARNAPTQEGYQAAHAQVASLFDIDPSAANQTPIDITSQTAIAAANEDELSYGLINAAFAAIDTEQSLGTFIEQVEREFVNNDGQFYYNDQTEGDADAPIVSLERILDQASDVAQRMSSSNVALQEARDTLGQQLTTAEAAQPGTLSDVDDVVVEPVEQTVEQVFVRSVAPIMDANCVSCHQPGANAATSGARWLLEPGEAEANYTATWDFLDVYGTDYWLAKARGELNHGGLRIINEGSANDQVLVTFLERVDAVQNNEAPVADASRSSNTSGRIGLTVSFDATASTDDNVGLSYAWDMGDGSAVQREAQLTHTYNSAGTYSAVLTVTDSQGLIDSDTITVTVTPNVAPTANIQLSTNSGRAPLAVNFDGTQSSDDVAVSTYSWDFGDGASGAGTLDSHTYNQAGTYTASLIVEDADGARSAAATATITVLPPNQAPIVDVSASSNTRGQAPLDVNFNATGSRDNDGSIASYRWTFADGSQGQGATVTHRYTTAGTYAAQVEVTDNEGASTTAMVQVEVLANERPQVAFTTDGLNRTAPATIRFDGSSSSDDVGIVSYDWNFGDGNTAQGAVVSHTYNNEGNFNGSLTVRDARGLESSASFTAVIAANQAPVANLGASRNTSGDAPLVVNFDASLSSDDNGIVSYQWDFGDGSSATGAQVSHTYSEGDYTATLTVRDAGGLERSDTVAISAVGVGNTNEAPNANASNTTPRSGDAPLTVNFDGLASTDDVAVTSYLWDFGDGNGSSAATASHVYSVAGTYNATLTVYDVEGLVDSENFTITVNAVNQAPVANISASTLSGDAPLDVNFDASGSSDDAGIVSYSWDFGDGSSSAGSSTSYRFGAGTHTVTLTVTDAEGLTGEAQVTITATAVDQPPVANASQDSVDGRAPSAASTYRVNFDGSASTDDIGIASYQWTFGDGNSASGAAVSHDYAPGNYTAVLTVTDTNGSTSTDNVSVSIVANQAPQAAVSASVLSGTVPLNVSFDATASTDDVGIAVYSWDFATGATATGSTSSYTFGTVGTFNVRLSVTDTDGVLTESYVAITVSEPTAAQIYTDQCASCHGASGEGGSGPSLTGATTYEALLPDVIRMPTPNGIACYDGSTDCAAGVTQYILDNFVTDEEPGEAFACDAPQEQAVRDLKRLAKKHYENTLHDLLARRFGSSTVESIMGALEPLLERVPEDHIEEGFNHIDQRVSEVHVEAYFNVAMAFAEEIASNNSLLVTFVGESCATEAADSACRNRFIENWGPVVFRRPLTDDDRSFYQAIDNYADLMAIMLSSPTFLYHTEFGGDFVFGSTDTLELTPHELASRLSYHFWHTMPDDQLRAEADSGEIYTNYNAIVDRLMADERAAEASAEFYLEYFRVDEIPEINTANIPGFAQFLTEDYGRGVGLPADMDLVSYRQDAIDEIAELTRYYTWETSGQFSDLYTSDVSFAKTADLAQAYGVTPWQDGDYSNLVRFPADERAGVLTRAATQMYGGLTTRPILEGVRIRRDLLCQVLPMPDNNDTPSQAEVILESSTRDKVAAITEIPGTACVSCHVEDINPAGFSTEDFDSLGRHRNIEVVFDDEGNVIGRPFIDSSSTPGIEDGDLTPVSGGVGLSQLMAESATAEACFVRHYFRYTYAREEEDSEDSCAMQDIHTELNNGDLRSMMRSVVNQDEFMQRKMGPQ